jgi:hypothetical protein
MREIMGVVRDAKFYQNHGANPAERPSLRVKAGLQCASPQDLQQVLPLLWGEAGRAPRHAASVQTAKMALVFSQVLRPSADGRAADAHLARNGCLGEMTSL